MRRPLTILACALAACALWAPAATASPQPNFGIQLAEVDFENEDGSPDTQAGSHPFAMNTHLVFDHTYDEATQTYGVEADLKDFFASQIAGLVGDATAYPRCNTADFLTSPGLNETLYSETECDESATAVGAVVSGVKGLLLYSPLLNLEPPPGVAARLGWDADGLKVILDVTVKHGGDYNIVARQLNLPQIFPIIGAKVAVWGVPADPAHDDVRGRCVAEFATNNTGTVPDLPFAHGNLWPEPSCPTADPLKPFLTLPRSCSAPGQSLFHIDSWPNPGPLLPEAEPDLRDPRWVSGEASTPPLGGCGRLGLAASIAARPTSRAAQSPTGLDFGLDVSDPGLANPAPEAVANADIEKAVLTLPRGMSANPSVAEGLETCSEADLARETPSSGPGQGCPQASKIGTVAVRTPIVGEAIEGSLYVATPYENLAGNSLIALYMVLANPRLGVIVKQPLRVEPDPLTGQLLTTAEELPPFPLSHVAIHLREGGRSPLISPPGCGAFEATAALYPSSGAPPLPAASSFQIVSGPDNSPCPPGAAPFHPGFQAGTYNNAAGRYSPFYMRLSRRDGEQDMTRFSSVLPPGVVGRIAGLDRCPEVAIAQAKARTGPHGAREELQGPSCPPSSQIGRTVAGAGVGSQLTYVGGSLYLAGPYRGDPLSVVSITPALAGPFDAGTVVVREALTLNPISAEVEVDGSASDPIPHILKGIPLNVRDLRVYADRPGFTLNATSCAPSLARATLWGGGTALAPSGETPVGLSARYQAAGCASLGFKPKLAIELKGGTRRGKFPALKAVVTPRPGDANFRSAVVTLPHSAFLEQGHFGTICTRVQFAAGGGNGEQCPPASIYGWARAWTPLLAEPAEGPVYLRSSSHNLPDLVVALKGPPGAPFEVQLASRIDSRHGGIRSTFEAIPDVPISRFILEMQGGRKGLIVNSTNLCRARHRAEAKLRGQNGRLDALHPPVRAAGCSKHKQRKRHRGHR